MSKFLTIGLVVLALVFSGCTPSDQQRQRAQTQQDMTEKVKTYLPPTAKNVQALGNGWYTFEMDELTSNRRTSKYLYRWWMTANGYNNHAITKVE